MNQFGNNSRNHNTSFETYKKEKGVGSINVLNSQSSFDFPQVHGNFKTIGSSKANLELKSQESTNLINPIVDHDFFNKINSNQ